MKPFADGRGPVLIIQVAIVLSCVAIWEIFARLGVLDNSIISTPSSIWMAGQNVLSDHSVLSDLRVTLLEITFGFLLAVVVGTTFGLLIGEVTLLHEIFYLPILVLYALPTIALFPMYVLFFGIGPLQKIIFAASWGVFPILVHTITGRRNIPGTLLTLGKALGGSYPQIWAKIVLPACLPLIATGLRIGMVYTILGVIVAELFMSSAGIGHGIVVAARHFNMPTYFFYVCVISAVSVALTYTVLRLERYLSRWRA
jgi:NitT/TauT family transport system permease protein